MAERKTRAPSVETSTTCKVQQMAKQEESSSGGMNFNVQMSEMDLVSGCSKERRNSQYMLSRRDETYAYSWDTSSYPTTAKLATYLYLGKLTPSSATCTVAQIQRPRTEDEHKINPA